MHLSLSIIGGTREEQLCILSAVLLWGVVAWLFTARAARKTNAAAATENNLEAPLLEDEPKHAIRSRVRLASRQAAYYVLAIYYAICFLVYSVRLLRSRGEQRARLYRAGADLLRAVAWIVAAKADAQECRSSPARPSLAAAAFVACSALAALRETRVSAAKFHLSAPSLWALCAHAVLLVVTLTGDKATPRERPPSPEENAIELHQIVGFTWLRGPVWKSTSERRPSRGLFDRKAVLKDENLAVEDLPQQVEGDLVETTWPRLQELLEKHPEARAGAPGRARTLALFGVLCRLCWPQFVAAGICRLFYIVTGYAQPLGLYIILRRFGKDDAFGWTAVGLLFGGPLLNATADALQMFLQRRVATRCRGAIMVLIYDKARRVDMAAASLPPAAAGRGRPQKKESGGGRVGEVVGLMSADVQNALTAIAYFHWVWGPVIQLVITLCALFWLVHVAAVGALIVIALNTVLNKGIFGRLAAASKEFLSARNFRLELVTEMLQGSRIIKMLGYESGIFDAIKGRREKELGKLAKILRLQVAVATLINATPPIMGVATFVAMSWLLGKPIDAATGFTTLTLLENLRFVLMQAPSAATFIITGYVSLQRVESFLDAPDVDQKPSSDGVKRGEVRVEDASFRWGGTADAAAATEENPLITASNPNERGLTLRGVDLRMAPGTLTLVVGVTGGGKSSLLAALLGEIRRVRGRVSVGGSTAYCPQQAWCQNASLKENICFGDGKHDARYGACIEACALGPDISSFPGGDGTEVGERGVTLSGGQQARVALARALYADADVYLLDDPLSAVDAHVGEHLFESAICGLVARGKTVVLATHQVSLALPRADQVVILTTDGTVAFAGTPAEAAADAAAATLLEDLADPESSKKDAPKAVAKSAPIGPQGNANSRLVEEEKRQKGAPLLSNFKLYLSAAGVAFLIGSSLFALQQPTKYVQANSLTNWISAMEAGRKPLSGNGLTLYLVWTAVFCVQTAIAISFQNLGALRASRTIHEKLSWAVLRNPVAWFDASPVGRVQNRFATDIQAVDRSVAMTTMFLIRSLVAPCVSLFAIGRQVPWLLPCFIPVLAVAFNVARNYLLLARDLKRIDSTTKSPVYALFNESLNGLQTLRSFDGAFSRFAQRFAGLVDRTNSAELHLAALSYWLSVRLNALGSTVAGSTALALYAQSLANEDKLSPPEAGLVLTYAVSFTAAIIGLMRTYTELELSMNAVERIAEYLDLPPEPPLELESDADGWLRERPAAVEFRDVVLRYPRQPEPALRGLTLKIEAGSSVGVVGRTGAGKSTLVQTILRLYNTESGSVLVDGVDVASVGLKTLRGRVAIVPQAPTLFAGTIRFNLDMFGERTDEELEAALELARGGGLAASGSLGSLTSLASLSDGPTEVAGEPANRVASLALDFELSEFGANLSVGERQLLCLARAIARKSRLVLMDEATANVDQKTDRLVQRVLNGGALGGATRITIAHRLGTIAACDAVAVLDDGKLREYAAPSSLLADADSSFSALCDAAGSRQSLIEAARRADERRANGRAPVV